MELIKGKTNYLIKLKEKLNKDEIYNNLIIRDRALYTYLKATFNEERNTRLLKEYSRIEKRMKNMELQATFTILLSFASERKKLKKQKYEEEFEDKFNELVIGDSNYRNQVKKRISIYDNLIKNNDYKFYLEKIQEIEIEIACMELEELKELYYLIELH